MLDRITEMTAGAGMERYEVSAYAQAGPSLPAQPQLLAVRRLPRHRRRRARQAQLPASRRAPGALARSGGCTWTAPLAGQAVAQDDEVARADLPFEFMLNALRLKEGFELAQFCERTGLPLSAIERAAAEAERRGLIERDLQHVSADRARLRFPERPASSVPGPALIAGARVVHSLALAGRADVALLDMRFLHEAARIEHLHFVRHTSRV